MCLGLPAITRAQGVRAGIGDRLNECLGLPVTIKVNWYYENSFDSHPITSLKLNFHSAEWYLRAAHGGDTEAQYLIGNQYFLWRRYSTYPIARFWLEPLMNDQIWGSEAQRLVSTMNEQEAAAKKVQQQRIAEAERKREENAKFEAFCKARGTPYRNENAVGYVSHLGSCHQATQIIQISINSSISKIPRHVFSMQLESMLNNIADERVHRFALQVAVRAYSNPERAQDDLDCGVTFATCIAVGQ
jgi:hypothetical protein